MMSRAPKFARSPGKDVFDVGWGVRGRSLDPADVTAALGFEPIWAYKRGDQYRSVTGAMMTQPWSVWGYCITEVAEDLKPAPVLERFLEQFRPVVGALAPFRADPSLRVSSHIHWEPDGGAGGYTLPAGLVAELCSLANEVDFYFS